jgi:hypothetical protein
LPLLGGKGRSELGEIGPVEQTRWVGLFLRRDARVEVTVAESQEQVTVLMNYHRQTKPDDIATAITAARTFLDDREDASELLRRADRSHLDHPGVGDVPGNQAHERWIGEPKGAASVIGHHPKCFERLFYPPRPDHKAVPV